MKKIISKFRVIFMFIIPSIAFLYFSYLHIQNEYKIQKNAQKYKYSIEVINILSNLIHNIQLERGLSAGYLVKSNIDIKKRLRKHYLKTDGKIKKILNLFKNNNFKKYIDMKNQKLLLEILSNIKKINKTRNSILNLSINFKDEIKYYTNINMKLISCIKYINFNFIHIHKDSNTIENIQLLKEYAGLERAYVYNQLLSVNKNNSYLKNIQLLQLKQEPIIKELLSNASKSSYLIYKTFYSQEIKNKIDRCNHNISNNKLAILDAENCFKTYTNYINKFDDINREILKLYDEESNKYYDNSIYTLYLTLFIWILSFILIVLIIYILIKLINKDIKNRLELKIAAYTFETHEGVVITDVDGVILKVNTSFTSITGYSAKEAIGQTPNILKSDRHHDNFYKKIWDDLIKNGKWQGDIFNKRKNEEIYLETLSITAIRDSDDNSITHYIAQFIDQSELKNIQQQLLNQVNHDFLTSLLNRKALIDRLQEEYVKALRYNFVHSFLFIDLDDFKNINDTYGHDTGDKLLIEISNRIKSIVREGDIVARLGGDEFAIILLNLNNNKLEAIKTVQQVCTKILEEISKELVLHKNILYINSSIGIKLFTGSEKNINDIMIEADKAMYQAKKAGKNNFIFSD